MPRQPDHDKIYAIYDYLICLQSELCDVLDGPPTKLRADSVTLLRELEAYYQEHLYPRLAATRG